MASAAAAARRQRYVLNDEDHKEVVEAFDLFDIDRRGKIGPHELKTAIRALGFQVSKVESMKLIAEFDVDNENLVDKESFVKILTRFYARRKPEEEIMEAFKLFDKDGTGKISVKNVRRIAKELGEALSEEELQAMVDEFDKDQDGEIDLNEFAYIMRQSSVF